MHQATRHRHRHWHTMHNAMHMRQTHSICMVMHMCETILIFNTYQNCTRENNVWLEFVASTHTAHAPWCALMHPNEIWKCCVRIRVLQTFSEVPYNVVLHILSRYQVFINFTMCVYVVGAVAVAIARLNHSFYPAITNALSASNYCLNANEWNVCMRKNVRHQHFTESWSFLSCQILNVRTNAVRFILSVMCLFEMEVYQHANILCN